MKIISRNAAILLFEKAESLSQNPHESWRCISLNFSGNKQNYSPALFANFVVKAVSDMLSDIDGHIYLCNDGDIFVLYQGALKPVIEKLSGHFADFKPTQEDKKGVFSIFDLSTDWLEFYDVCEAKYMKAANTSEEIRTQLFNYTRPATTRHVARTPTRVTH